MEQTESSLEGFGEAGEPVEFRFGPLGSSLDPRCIALSALIGILGLAAIFFGIVYGLNSRADLSDFKSTMGRVVKVEEWKGGARSQIQFYTDQDFSEVVEKPGFEIVGEYIPVYYSALDPQTVYFDLPGSNWVLAVVVMLVGVVFAAVGFAAAWRNYIRRKYFKWLSESGERVEARVIRVIEPLEKGFASFRSGEGTHTNQQMLGFDPLAGKNTLVALWKSPQGDATREFCSEQYAGCSAPDIIGASVRVFISKDDARLYYVDLNTVRVPD